MKKSAIKALLVSGVAAVVLGGGLAYGLYSLSQWFFATKHSQTKVKSAELGKALDEGIIWPVGSKVPNVELSLLHKRVVYNAEQDPAKIKILNFWASWCEPCVEEFSSLARLLKNFSEEEVSLIALSEDNTVKDADQFLQGFDKDFSGLKNAYFAYDYEKVYLKKYGVLALPESFIIDQEGKLIRRVSGFEVWDTPEAINYFKHLLQKGGNEK